MALGRRDLLRLSGAAVLVADETPPQHRAAAGRTVALHGQQVGRLRLQEVFGEADHVNARPTGRVEAAQLLGRLDRLFAEKTPGCLLLLLLLFLSCRLQLLLGPHAPEGDGDVQRRLQAGLKVHPVLLFEPAGRQRQAAPGRRPQHVGDDAPVEPKARLLPGAPGHVGEAPGGVRVLPRPLKTKGSNIRGEAVNDEDHLPRAFPAGPLGSPSLPAGVVLADPALRVHGEADINPTFELRIGAEQHVHPEEVFDLDNHCRRN